MQRRILANAAQYADPAEMAACLKKLFGEDPNGLFDALVAMGKGALETRRSVLPLLAEALTLWPEAEGRYVFPIADAYAAIDLPAAAEWGATFLVKTGRTDLAVSTLLGRLGEVSESRALALIASLPEASRTDAINSFAGHMPLGDLNDLMQVGAALDPPGTSTFWKQLFDRLGMERLSETAAWLAATPVAVRIPGAVAAISQALVRNDDPQKAIAWADSLSDQNARAEAIAAVYREWAQGDPESAIQDILAAYDGAPQLMADVFKGAADHHGSDAAAQWETACRLANPSARAYAISALIDPMLITVGPAETRSKIASLPSGSLERDVAELMMQAAYQNPTTVRQIGIRFGKTQG